MTDVPGVLEQAALPRHSSEPSTAASRLRALSGALSIASVLLMLLVILMHLPLLSLGQWQDEFETFAWYRDGSFSALYSRLMTWSPRPVSELAIFIYAIACERLHRPLFVDVLSVSWLAFVLPSLLVLVREMRTRANGSSVWARVNIAAALPIVCLVSVELPDTFLWPMSSLAYLPAIACVFGTFFVLLHCDPKARSSWVIMSALGVLGICCVEMAGMVYGIFFSGLLLWTTLDYSGRDDKPSWRFRAACCFPPISAAATTGLLVLTHRARSGSPLTADTLLVHRPFASIVNAVPIFLENLVGQPASIYRLEPARVTAGLFSRVAWCAGTIMLGNLFVGPERSTALALIKLFGMAIVVACFCSIAATLYQFGIMCCERQDTSRACFEYVALACLGVYLAARFNESRFLTMISLWRTCIGTSLILLALILPLPLRLKSLAAVYDQQAGLKAATVATWQSGWRPSDTSMIFFVLPRDPLIGKARDDRGTHVRVHEPVYQVKGIMNYFKKEQVSFDHRQTMPARLD